MKKKILVNGASGRIGRAVTYELLRAGLDIAALNDPVGIDKIVESLAGKDYVHGKFGWTVEKLDDKTILVEGNRIDVYAARDLAQIPFREKGIQIVEECSGFFGEDKKSGNLLARHFLDYGVEHVILSYPAKTPDVTIVMGANHEVFNPAKHRVISNGSCTTKAIAAPLAVLMRNGIGIERFLMDTVHASTNSQNLLESLDNISTHKTGAAEAIGEVFPGLKGKMDGLSFRVPTSDGSFANIHMVAFYQGELFAQKLNRILENHASDSEYYGRIAVFREKEATTRKDIVGRTENGIVILDKTRVMRLPYTQNGKNTFLIGLVSGYDNERGPPRDQVILTNYILNNSDSK